MPIILNANGLYQADNIQLFNKSIAAHQLDKTACIITTADQDYKEKNHHAVATKQLLEEQHYCVAYVDVEFEDVNRLKDYAVIYINGGNPFYLLYHLRRSGADQIIRQLHHQGRLIVGQSAGAAVLGRTIEHANVLHPEWNTIPLADFAGIGIVESCILPHSNRYEAQEGILQQFEITIPYPLVRIPDGTCIVR